MGGALAMDGASGKMGDAIKTGRRRHEQRRMVFAMYLAAIRSPELYNNWVLGFPQYGGRDVLELGDSDSLGVKVLWMNPRHGEARHSVQFACIWGLPAGEAQLDVRVLLGCVRAKKK